jgi:hypothetical protein
MCWNAALLVDQVKSGGAAFRVTKLQLDNRQRFLTNSEGASFVDRTIERNPDGRRLVAYFGSLLHHSGIIVDRSALFIGTVNRRQSDQSCNNFASNLEPFE